MEIKKNIRKKYKILVVDDEPLIRESLYEIFKIQGYRVHRCASAEEAMEILEKNSMDIIISDLKLPQMSGIDFLKKAKKKNSNMEFILITGYGSIDTAVDAMKNGAYTYITKPINDEEIKIIINKIIENKEILNENKRKTNIIL